MPSEGRTSIRKLLRRYDACAEAIDWAADKERLHELWDQCEVPEWLLWSLDQLNYRADARLRAFAVACARRHTGLLEDDKVLRVLSVADAVAANAAPPGELLEASQDARAAADAVAQGADWNAARAAAISAVYDTVRGDPMEAARGASTNGQRVVAWQVGTSESVTAEARWQAQQLRRRLDQDVPKILQRARAAMVERP